MKSATGTWILLAHKVTRCKLYDWDIAWKEFIPVEPDELRNSTFLYLMLTILDILLNVAHLIFSQQQQVGHSDARPFSICDIHGWMHGSNGDDNCASIWNCRVEKIGHLLPSH